MNISAAVKAAVKKDYGEAIKTKNVKLVEREISMFDKTIKRDRAEIENIKELINEQTQIKEALKTELSKMRRRKK